ncbi:MAG: class I SAM-dependent methyltransferase [Patescibacteria group bacterium]|jgi:ubiquinone/menaquinone biosynthesis C-methylase UbiE
MRTDWNKVSIWYGKHLQKPDTYQHSLIFPKTLHLLQPQPDKHYLDIACGEGALAEHIIKTKNTHVTGVDLAPNLIAQANKKQLRNCHFIVGDATNFPKQILEHQFDGATCILALQNIADITPIFKATAKVLKPNSPLIIVLNHPCFRPPQQSGWGFDEPRKLQYRRIDTYMSSYHVNLTAHPGKKTTVSTVSFHRPLQDYINGLGVAGFMIDRLEEWTSNRASQPGGRAKAENRSRQEFPLFMAIRAYVTSF